jgi:shikimate kinase
MSSQLPIVLVGPMGVGKTTIGKKLAKRLEVSFVDSDAEIVKQHGPIDRIFAELGEPTFRAIEADTIATQLSTKQVIATGGGAVLSERTRLALDRAIVVYLTTDGRHIASRLSTGNRPLIKDGINDWRRIYNSRRSLYEEVADITVDTSSASLALTIESILKGLEDFDKQ